MTTTIMKDSIVGDAWIREMIQNNPIQRVIDPDTGVYNGIILSGPVRLAFTDRVFTPDVTMKANASDPNAKKTYGCAVLWPPGVDMTIMYEEATRIQMSDFPSHPWNAQAGWWAGLEPALAWQDNKPQYEGFTPGAMFSNLSSQYPPGVFDARHNTIVDQSQIYAGVWAIVAMNVYASGKGFPKKGPRFGLASIMKVGDDKPLAGGAPDPHTTFKGVNVRAPAVTPSASFGQQPPGPPAAPGGAAGTYYPPGGHAPAQPSPPRPAGVPAPPVQQVYSPPAPAAPADPNDLSQFMS